MGALLKMTNDETEEIKMRILSFMLYKGYVGKKTITEKKLVEDMKKDGWFDIPMIRIQALLRQEGVLNE